MDLNELAQRIEALEDREAVRRLKARYAEACDDGYNLAKLADLFTEDAVCDFGAYGRYRGKEEILANFANSGENWTFAVHYFTLPDIELSGNRATGYWQLWQPVTIRGHGATWLSAIEDDEYEKIDGRWFIKSIRFVPFFHTPYDLGWDKQRSL